MSESPPRQPTAEPGPPPVQRDTASVQRVAASLVVAAIVITGLYFGRELLIPLAIAFLLAFVLDPLVFRLKRRGVPRVIAVSLVVTLLLGVLVAIGALLTTQVRSLGNELPLYEANIREKLRDLQRRAAAPGPLEGAARTIESVKKDVEAVAPAAPPSGPPVQRVQVEPAPESGLRQAMDWIAASSGPLANAGIAFVFLVLVLLDRQDLRDRLLRLLGGNLHRTTDAIDEAGERITRYLSMQLVVNASYGLPMALGLWLIGVPGALLWGVVAAMMRFVPYVGPLVAAVFPLALAFAVDPGWSLFIWTAALIVLLELVSNNIVEPWLYGASTGLSAMSLIAAATFWALLWGPVGLLLSTPLTVCLLVIGRHLPGLQFLDVLLGSQPVLDAPTRFYQRLIAGNVEELLEMAEERIESASVGDFYDEVAIPALRLASQHHDTAASTEHRHRVVQGMDQVIDELGQQHPAAAGGHRLQVVCLGGKWEVDALAARMLAHTLALSGTAARHLEVDVASPQFVKELDLRGASMVCLSHFSPDPRAQVRYLCRRLRRRWPDLRIALALWNVPADLLDEAGLHALGADCVAMSIEEMALRVEQHLGTRTVEGFLAAPAPADDAARVRALRGSDLLDGRLRREFDRAAKRAADVFDVPIALVNLVDEQSQQVCGTSGGGLRHAGEPLTDGEHDFNLPRPLSICGHLVADGASMVVEDIARDPRFAANPAVLEKGLRFYAGAPLRDRDGFVYGSLCLLDTEPRTLAQRELRLLESMAADLMERLAAHAPAASPGLVRDGAGSGAAPTATVGQPVP
ncbi:AI-2E family transporter [Ramlibacter sp. AW1]|uniref:AI-2E family transporter n=1 Tax=Ramlibacter aurantiacus TaxID=2801330 RepID=A0A936ZRA0_9BURK|nr:AI-2E family transporter [Ramlibacter aurantiacus]MBL0421076.1 AI-2E family transporter [Ramlibacter aurantiacus]